MGEPCNIGNPNMCRLVRETDRAGSMPAHRRLAATSSRRRLVKTYKGKYDKERKTDMILKQKQMILGTRQHRKNLVFPINLVFPMVVKHTVCMHQLIPEVALWDGFQTPQEKVVLVKRTLESDHS